VSTEIMIELTPREAADGVTRVVPLPSGPRTLRIPPCRDGSLVRVTDEGRQVSLRIRVTADGGASATRPRRPAALLVLGAAVAVILAAASCDRGADNDAADPYPAASSSYDATGGAADDPTPSPTPTSTDTDSTSASGTYGGGTDTWTPPTPTPTPTPYETGTCLNGTLPDSTTAQEVNDVTEVDCSSSDAHYRVIQTFNATTDLNECNSNPDTQYAFSSRTTLGGSVINEYVYCLVGLGSYAR
jgi:hypothetical protein